MSKRQQKRRLKKFLDEKKINIASSTPGPFEFIPIVDNLKTTFNIGKIIRSANAFGAKEVHLIGTEFFDVSMAKGSFKHTPAKFYDRFVLCHKDLTEQGYTIFALDPGEGSVTLGDVNFPDKSAFVIGHEEYGFSFPVAEFKDVKRLNIPQFGKVQSLNASVAASIAMFEYVRQKN